mgnify:CR=1 FL=1
MVSTLTVADGILILVCLLKLRKDSSLMQFLLSGNYLTAPSEIN